MSATEKIKDQALNAPDMWIIKPHSPGSAAIRIRQLTHDECSDAAAYYSGHEVKDKERVRSLLSYLWNNHLWLSCKCTSSESGHPALHVRRSFNGTISLVRIKERTSHHKACPFYRNSDSRSRQTAHKVESRDKLASFIQALLQESQLSDLYSDRGKSPKPLSEQYHQLRSAFESVKLEYGFDKEAVMVTHPDSLRRVKSQYATISRKHDTHNQVLLCFPVIEKSKKNIRLQHGSETFDCHVPGTITQICNTQATTKGPFLGFILCDKLPLSMDRIHAIRAVLVPVVSRSNYTPIYSELDRQLYYRLSYLQKWWRERYKVHTVIHSTVIDPSCNVGGFTVMTLDNRNSVEPIWIQSKLVEDDIPLREYLDTDEADMVYLVNMDSDGQLHQISSKKFGQILSAKLLRTADNFITQQQ